MGVAVDKAYDKAYDKVFLNLIFAPHRLFGGRLRATMTAYDSGSDHGIEDEDKGAAGLHT
jgi:hypothetical protein